MAMQDSAQGGEQMRSHVPDENDLPDEEIFAMWERGEPVEIAEGPPPGSGWFSGWSSLGQTEPEQWRATVKQWERALSEQWRATMEHWERARHLYHGVPWRKERGEAAYEEPSQEDVDRNKRVLLP